MENQELIIPNTQPENGDIDCEKTSFFQKLYNRIVGAILLLDKESLKKIEKITKEEIEIQNRRDGYRPIMNVRLVKNSIRFIDMHKVLIEELGKLDAKKTYVSGKNNKFLFKFALKTEKTEFENLLLELGISSGNRKEEHIHLAIEHKLSRYTGIICNPNTNYQERMEAVDIFESLVFNNAMYFELQRLIKEA